MNANDDGPLYTSAQAGRLSGIGVDQLRTWRKRGHVPWVKTAGGKHPRYGLEDICALRTLLCAGGEHAGVARAIDALGGPAVLFPTAAGHEGGRDPPWLLIDDGGLYRALAPSDAVLLKLLARRQTMTVVNLWAVYDQVAAWAFELKTAA